MSEIIYSRESYKIIGICMDIHTQLGPGFLEIVYKDALEYELNKSRIPFEREKKYAINYKGIKLAHKFYADFVVYNKIILEVKAVTSLSDNFMSQAINYLKVSSNKLALIINFGEMKLKYTRVVL